MSALLSAMKAPTPRFLYMNDEASGSPVDQSGNGFHGTVVGSPTYRYANAVPGLRGMRHQTSNVTVPAAALDTSGTQDYTILFWVKTVTAPPSTAAHVFFSNGASESAVSPSFYTNSNGALVLYQRSGGGDSYIYIKEGAFTQPNWFTVAWGITLMGVAMYTSGGSQYAKFIYDGRYWGTARQEGPSYVEATGTAATGVALLTGRGDYNSMKYGSQHGYWSNPDTLWGPIAGYHSVLTDAQLASIYRAGLRNGVSY